MTYENVPMCAWPALVLFRAFGVERGRGRESERWRERESGIENVGMLTPSSRPKEGKEVGLTTDYRSHVAWVPFRTDPAFLGDLFTNGVIPRGRMVCGVGREAYCITIPIKDARYRSVLYSG